MLKSATNIIKKLIAAVKGAFKFFRSLIGHISLYVIAAILIAILIYIIAMVIAEVIGGLLGIKAPAADDQARDLAFLSSLEDSGYSDMLSADELIRYYSYEYCVLMDAARYLEETGTTELAKQDESPIDFTKINRVQWAILAAIQFSTDASVDSKTFGSDYAPTYEEPSGEPTTKYTMGDPDNPEDSGELFYEKTYNEYTKEYSLQPFLRVDRYDDMLKYFFEIRDGSDSSDTQQFFFQDGTDLATSWTDSDGVAHTITSVSLDDSTPISDSYRMQHGTYMNLDDISATVTFDDGSIRTFKGKELLGSLFRFEGGIVSGMPWSYAAGFIYRYVWALKFNSFLNSSNIASITPKDIRYSAELQHVDLNQDNFAQELYYQDTQSKLEYNVPLRVMLDRFLPNASLLSSWRLLSEDERSKSKNITIIEEMFKIYDEACLKDEECSGDKILLKDVAKVTTSSGANPKSDAKVVNFDGTGYLTDKELKLDEYYDKSKTSTFYGSYLPLWDTRSGDEGRENGEQAFKGTCLTDDIIDDLKLVLTHYEKDQKVTFKKEFIENTLNDITANKLIDESKTDGKEEIVLYRRNDDGGAFLIKCVGAQKAYISDYSIIRPHYNIDPLELNKIDVSSEDHDATVVKVDGNRRSHESIGNPYSTGAKYNDCLIPFLKFTFKIDDKGLKKTSVLICDDNTYYGYMVVGKQVDNYSKLTNKHSFIEMEATTLKSSTFKHWELAQDGGAADGSEDEISDESWIVTDAFEGLGVNVFLPEGNSGFKFGWKLNWSESWKKHTSTKKSGDEDVETTVHGSGSKTHETYEEDEMSLDDMDLLEDLGISGDFFIRIILFGDDFNNKTIEEEYPGKMVYLPKNSTSIVRTPAEYDDYDEVMDALEKERDYTLPPSGDNPFNLESCDMTTPDASPSEGLKSLLGLDGENVYGGKPTYTDGPGETTLTEEIFIKLKELGINTDSTDALDKLTLEDTKIIECIKKYLNEMDGGWDKKKFVVYKYYLWKNYHDLVISHHISGPRDQNFTNGLVKTMMQEVADLKVEEWITSPNHAHPSNVCDGCCTIDLTAENVDWADMPQGSQAPFWVDAINENLQLSAVFPTRICVCPITQRVLDKTMNAYFVKSANYWAADKDFKNKEIIEGEFLDKDNYFYLITNNGFAQGLRDIESKYKSVSWRTGLFAPIFGGLNVSEQQREDDIKMILSEWEAVGNKGVNAADHSIRDLNYLIQYSKGIKPSGEEAGDSFEWEPEKDSQGDPYVHYDSFTYLYIPEEILNFDELTTEKIFWVERIITARQDPVNDEYENKMRSRLNTFTWQVVDYNLYEETLNDQGTHNVYALWLFGDQTSRDLYSFDSNANEKENERVKQWGGFSGAHKAADLYGRSQSSRIYNTAFGATQGPKQKKVFNQIYGYAYNTYPEVKDAKIKAKGTGSGVVLYNASTGSDDSDLTGATDPSGEYFYYGDNGNLESISLNETNAGSDLLYSSGVPVTIRLGSKEYTFNGPASAAYGYNLFALTSQLGDGAEAERVLKDQLEKEMQWQEVRAVAPGIVRNIVSDAVSGFGVILTHTGAYGTTQRDNDTITTSYCHMKRYPIVQVGQYVGAGSILGYEGTTGKSGGYHTHMHIRIGNGADDAKSPNRYMYPFFTPFWNQEKADEVIGSVRANPLQSGYFALSRTAFPFGQVIDSGLYSKFENQKDEPSFDAIATNEAKATNIKTVEPTHTLMNGFTKNDGGYVNIKNYTPQNPLVDDSDKLLTKDNEPDFSRPDTSGVVHRMGGSTYNGDSLHTNPDYIDDEFIKDVYSNNQKIKGVLSRAIIN